MPALLSEFRAALAANSTSTAFAAKIPIATEPTGTGVHDLTGVALGVGTTNRVPSYLQLIPYGTDGNNDTFDMRLYGWNKVNGSSVWVPQLLLDISVVLGNMAGTVIAASTFMADTITVNDGAADNGPWRSLVDCQEDLPGSVIVHTRGCRYIEFDWDLVGAQEAVSMNCLWRALEV